MFEFAKTYLKVLYHHHREIDSITRGIINFKLKNESQRSQLRRNIHRLEKALIMKPLKKVFAEGYIQETVDLYNICKNNNQISEDELKWFHSVLTEYFCKVDKTEVVSLAFNNYQRPCDAFASDKSIPYEERERAKSKVDFNDLESLFKRRRSVRFYQAKKPNMADIVSCINISNQAPSACNRQPFRLVYTDNPQITKQIAGTAGGTAGYADQIPGIFVVVGDLDYFNNPFDRHVTYIDSSLFVMQLLLALETKELSTCVINWPDYAEQDRRIRDIVKLKDTERVMMLISVGYADESSKIPFSHKKSAVDLLEVYK